MLGFHNIHRFRFSTALLSFLFLPFWLTVSASQWLVQLSYPFSLLRIPILSCLISRAFFYGSHTWISVRFLSSFLVSLPQLFHKCLPFAFAFGLFPYLSSFFRPILFRFRLLGFLLLPFHSFWLYLTVVSPVCDLAFALSLSPFSWTWFLMSSFQVLVLGFLFVSFRSSLFRSHSRSTGVSLWYSLGLVLDFRFST